MLITVEESIVILHIESLLKFSEDLYYILSAHIISTLWDYMNYIGDIDLVYSFIP